MSRAICATVYFRNEALISPMVKCRQRQAQLQHRRRLVTVTIVDIKAAFDFPVTLSFHCEQ